MLTLGQAKKVRRLMEQTNGIAPDGGFKTDAACPSLGSRLPSVTPSRVAFKTQLEGIESIVAARSYAQAKHLTILSARDAGFHAKFIDVRCQRAPRFDSLAERLRGGCFSVRIAEQWLEDASCG